MGAPNSVAALSFNAPRQWTPSTGTGICRDPNDVRGCRSFASPSCRQISGPWRPGLAVWHVFGSRRQRPRDSVHNIRAVIANAYGHSIARLTRRPGSIAQLVRALALQARGQQFESACSHHMCGPSSEALSRQIGRCAFRLGQLLRVLLTSEQGLSVRPRVGERDRGIRGRAMGASCAVARWLRHRRPPERNGAASRCR